MICHCSPCDRRANRKDEATGARAPRAPSRHPEVKCGTGAVCRSRCSRPAKARARRANRGHRDDDLAGLAGLARLAGRLAQMAWLPMLPWLPRLPRPPWPPRLPRATSGYLGCLGCLGCHLDASAAGLEGQPSCCLTSWLADPLSGQQQKQLIA